jgi:hypothetical protein
MPKGKSSEVGETMTNANGYSCTRTKDGWRFTHHLIAEAKIGRPINRATEMVKFEDGDRSNLNPDNIIIVARKTASANARLAKLIAQRAEIDAQIKAIQKELGSYS